ncbi:MAG: hypothetical protein GOVbin1807_2 [Prokaryotic dsDNA virus sp.]|mgnify:CR=1 FL=1|nr:MAG: hypothetical protein GOVbin1807_2 [Prokaryotic dsDNA virus sp.]|tara:strand:+ start:1356 stop:1502 length:147 start_codon:yes stop_codon:yes gene_type:complete
MGLGSLVKHEGLLQEIGIITKICDELATVFFPEMNTKVLVYLDDLEAL